MRRRDHLPKTKLDEVLEGGAPKPPKKVSRKAKKNPVADTLSTATKVDRDGVVFVGRSSRPFCERVREKKRRDERGGVRRDG